MAGDLTCVAPCSIICRFPDGAKRIVITSRPRVTFKGTARGSRGERVAKGACGHVDTTPAIVLPPSLRLTYYEDLNASSSHCRFWKPPPPD